MCPRSKLWSGSLVGGEIDPFVVLVLCWMNCVNARWGIKERAKTEQSSMGERKEEWKKRG